MKKHLRNSIAVLFTILAFVGCSDKADYSDWVKLTYAVSDSSEPVQLFFHKENTFLGESTKSFDILKVSQVYSESINEPINYQYTFSHPGRHVVYVKFEDMTQIPDYAFQSCDKLEEVSIPASVQKIGKEAFAYCRSMKSITIPNSVTVIEEGAFSSCRGVTSIVVDPENPVYDSRNNCNAIMETASNTLIHGCKTTAIPDNCTAIGDKAFVNNMEVPSVLTIPDAVKSIGEHAFAGCVLIKEVNIGKGLEYMGYAPFASCSHLEKITVEAENGNFDSRNNCNAIMETATNILLAGCINTVIPDDCEAIGDGAYWGCGEITSVTIPGSVKVIGKEAFFGSSIKRVSIGAGVHTIKDNAFAGCMHLEEKVIGPKVKNIGNKAFSSCYKLEKIISLASTAPEINYGTFSSVSNTGTIYAPKNSSGYLAWVAMTPDGWGLNMK